MNNKSLLVCVLIAQAQFTTPSQAALVTWDNSSADSNWFTASNWDTDTVPNVDGSDNVLIGNGDSVIFNPSSDLDVSTGSSITVTAGSSVSQTVNNWQRLQGGSLTINNATWSTASYFVVGFDDGDAGGTLDLQNGALLTVGGELWFGPNPGRPWDNGSVVNLNISGGSTLDLNGGVGLWLWDSDVPGADYNINFTGTGNIEGRIGIEESGATDNAVTWEALWNKGILQWNGSNTGSFSDYFSTTGAAGTTGYNLIAVPEPSSAALLGLSGLALILRRKR